MTSYFVVIAAIYLMIGGGLTMLIVGNMPVIIDGPMSIVLLVLMWPIALWSFFGAGAMMFAVGVYIVVSHGLYRWMI